MKRALELASKGRSEVGGNPMVGAVFVKKGEIVGEGYHAKFGGDHAEVSAIKSVDDIDVLKGADLYVTLEPCCVKGKTPACTDALLGLGLKNIFVAMEDPNPNVDGRGIKILEEHGVVVEVGMLGVEARLLNQRFIKNVSRRLPYVVFKTAMSLDGKTACRDGSSQWISGEESRVLVHEIRNEVDAIVVGAGTVVEDDPHLGVRLVAGRDPMRIVFDRNLRTDIDSKVYRDSNVLVVCEESADLGRKDFFESNGIELLVMSERFGLEEVLKVLYEKGFYSVLIEAGGTLSGEFWRADLIDKYVFFIAPKLIGGDRGVFQGDGVENISDVVGFEDFKTRMVGSDIMVEAFRRIF